MGEKKRKSRKKSRLNELAHIAGGAGGLAGAVEDIHLTEVASTAISAAEVHAKIVKKGRDAARNLI